MQTAELLPAMDGAACAQSAAARATISHNEKPPAALAEPAAQEPSPSPLNLAALAETAMRARPGQSAYRRGRGTCEDLPEALPRFSNLALMREVVRVSAFLQVLRLPPLSPIAVMLPNVPEAAAVTLAALHAGHRPLPLPCTLAGRNLVDALERAGCLAGITLSRIADTSPAEALREAAAACFGMRFVAAYGPGVPDGVIGLDLLPTVRGDALLAASRNDGLSILLHGGRDLPVRAIDCEALVAGAMAILASARMVGGERLVTLLPPDDLAGVMTGIAAPLLAGMPVTTIDLFDSRVLADELGGDEPCHLVAPAWLEPALAASGLLRSPGLRSVLFVAPAPWRADATGTIANPRLRVLDLVEAGGTALLAALRRDGRQEGIPLAEPFPVVAKGLRLTDARVENGALFLAGRGVTRTLHREPAEDGWHATGLAATLAGGRIVALSPGA